MPKKRVLTFVSKKTKNKKTLQRKEKAWGGGGGDFNLGFEPFLKKKLNKHAHIEM